MEIDGQGEIISKLESRVTSKTNLDLTPMLQDSCFEARSDLDTQEIQMNNQGTGMH